MTFEFGPYLAIALSIAPCIDGAHFQPLPARILSSKCGLTTTISFSVIIRETSYTKLNQPGILQRHISISTCSGSGRQARNKLSQSSAYGQLACTMGRLGSGERWENIMVPPLRTTFSVIIAAQGRSSIGAPPMVYLGFALATRISAFPGTSFIYMEAHILAPARWASIKCPATTATTSPSLLCMALTMKSSPAR